MSRRKRRALLAFIIIAGTPAWAEGPADTTARVPLPLTKLADSGSQAESGYVLGNPFCEAAPARAADSQHPFSDINGPIHLTSGNQTSSIRLKPIGAAIGLQSIDRHQGVKSAQPTMTIEEIGRPAVRSNPLVGSTHHENDELVDAEIDDRSTRPILKLSESAPAAAQPAGEEKQASSIVLVAPKAADVSHLQSDSPVATTPVIAGPVMTPPVMIGPVMAPPAMTGPTMTGPAMNGPAMNGPAIRQPANPSESPNRMVGSPSVLTPSIAEPSIAGPSIAGAGTASPSDVEPAIAGANVPEPLGDLPPAAPPVPATSATPAPSATPSLSATPSGAMELATQAIDENVADPVYFSISDRFNAPQPDEPEVSSGGLIPAVELDLDDADESPQVADVGQLALGDEEGALPVPVNIGLDGSVEVGMTEPLAQQDTNVSEDLTSADPGADSSSELSRLTSEDEADDAIGLEPIDPVIGGEGNSPIAMYRSEPELVRAAPTPEQTLHNKRYRPPVAVKPVPIAYERMNEQVSEPNLESAVQAVTTLNLGGGRPAGGKSVGGKLTPLYMSRAQVRSLTVGGAIRSVQVADKGVCQAFAAGPNQLKLIGTGHGVTRLVVWADADDIDAPTRVRTFEIHVKDGVETTGEDIGNKTVLLNQSIQRAFPTSNVTVRRQHGQLVVSGRCDSEASAKKIIRMVRKTCLVPVQDKLMVR